MNKHKNAEKERTVAVALIVSFRVPHFTFFNSFFVSFKKLINAMMVSPLYSNSLLTIMRKKEESCFFSTKFCIKTVPLYHTIFCGKIQKYSKM